MSSLSAAGKSRSFLKLPELGRAGAEERGAWANRRRVRSDIAAQPIFPQAWMASQLTSEIRTDGRHAHSQLCVTPKSLSPAVEALLQARDDIVCVNEGDRKLDQLGILDARGRPPGSAALPNWQLRPKRPCCRRRHLLPAAPRRRTHGSKA